MTALLEDVNLVNVVFELTRTLCSSGPEQSPPQPSASRVLYSGHAPPASPSRAAPPDGWLNAGDTTTGKKLGNLGKKETYDSDAFYCSPPG